MKKYGKLELTAEECVELLNKKLSYINSEKFIVSVEHASDGSDWFSIRINTKHVCAGDIDWILTPGKLEMHLFTRGREFGEEHILQNYNCHKKLGNIS